MTQGLALGITVGSSITVAVTTSGGCDEAHVHTRPPGRTPAASEDFLSRVGDPVDILTADGTSIAAADLVVRVIGGAVADLSPARTVAGYPAWWSRHTVDAQRAALDRAGLGAVMLVPEPIAALRNNPAAAPMVVYDLGATGVSVAVVGTGPRPSLLAEPLRDAEIAGSEFDLLTMRYVLANSLEDNDFDPFDPIIESELSALRHRCKKAKEDLSGNTVTTIPVRLPGTPGTVRDIRLVRDELEDLLRDPLSRSLALVHEALRRGGLSRDTVGGILLTGGGGSIPLLTELLSTEFGLPIRTAPDPAHTAARGAALLASDLLAEPSANAAPLAARSTPTVPQPDSTPIPPPKRNPILPPLPQQLEPRRLRTWQRATLVGGAVAVVAALTTGTLALGTSAQSTPRTTAPSTSATSAPTAQPAAGHASPAIAPAVGAATTPGATGAIQPTGNAAAEPPGSTAPTAAPNQPAPDAPNPAAPPGSPAPQPNPPAPAPAPQPPTAPPPPERPAPDLGNTLNSGLDQTGNTLGTVLQAPGRVLPHTGG
ncbi:Hsp70 family protein [Nocardia terpenica]|uniref:Hsp70 family protein n=1 Tax=Nocardia terpenica TaxID=455432 RepID=UPI002FE1CC0D